MDRVGIPPLCRGDGSLETSSRGKACLLNEQYSSVFSDGDGNIPDLGPSPYNPMPPIVISTNGVRKLLSGLNTNRAVGPDKLPTRLLKDFAEFVAPVLQVIFQQSIDTGVLPEDWKQANVVAIFKKGDKHMPSNYRPVSLTCVTCKVLEHIVFRSIMSHLDLNNVLVHFQHGFRTRHSCETQLKIWLRA